MKKTNQIPRDTRRHCQHGIPADVCQFCANDSVVKKIRIASGQRPAILPDRSISAFDRACADMLRSAALRLSTRYGYETNVAAGDILLFEPEAAAVLRSRGYTQDLAPVDISGLADQMSDPELPTP